MLPEMVHVCLLTRGTVLQTMSTPARYLQELCQLLAEDSPARGLEALTGQGVSPFKQEGAAEHWCDHSFVGTGQNSHLVSNWAVKLISVALGGMLPLQRVSFMSCVWLQGSASALALRQKFSLLSPSPQRGDAWAAACRAGGVPWRPCKPWELIPLRSAQGAGGRAGSVPWLSLVRGVLWK